MGDEVNSSKQTAHGVGVFCCLGGRGGIFFPPIMDDQEALGSEEMPLGSGEGHSSQVLPGKSGGSPGR